MRTDGFSTWSIAEIRQLLLPSGLEPLAERPEDVESVVRAYLYGDDGRRVRRIPARGARRRGPGSRAPAGPRRGADHAAHAAVAKPMPGRGRIAGTSGHRHSVAHADPA